MTTPDRTITLLQELITIRSDVSTTNDESELVTWISEFIGSCPGWKVQEQKVDGKRKNIIAFTSKSPQVVFVGHMDTVPVINPEQLTPKIIDDRLYGRGAVDMKAGLAIMLRMAEQFSQPGIGLIFTVDEEYNFLGMKKLVQDVQWKPKMVFNPEPTNLKAMNACRGIIEFAFTYQGKTAHASRPQLGVNAITTVVTIMEALQKEAQQFDSTMETTLNLASLNGGIFSNGEISVQPNMIPDRAEGVADIRVGNKEVTPRWVQKTVERLSKKFGGTVVEYRWNFAYSPLVGRGEDLLEFTSVMKSCDVEQIETNPNETGFYETQILAQAWNCPVTIFGPGPSEMAHKVDEYVSISQLKKAEEIYFEYVKGSL